MYRVSYLHITQAGPVVENITHPKLEVAIAVHDAFVTSGVHARLWDIDGMLIPSPVRCVLSPSWDELLEKV